jgi:hypothetical protein
MVGWSEECSRDGDSDAEGGLKGEGDREVGWTELVRIW